MVNILLSHHNIQTVSQSKKQSIGNFPITFKPKWTNKAEARLIMSNPLTMDHFEYDIIGNGEEPLAEEHL